MKTDKHLLLLYRKKETKPQEKEFMLPTIEQSWNKLMLTGY